MLACRCFWCQCFNHQVINCPLPQGPCWRRIWQQRRLLKASRAGEICTDNNSSAPLPGAPAPNSLLSTTRAGKSVLSSSQVPAASPAAEGPMCAGTVSRTTQLQNVILQAQLPLNLDSFKCIWPATWTGSGVRACCWVFAKGWTLVFKVKGKLFGQGTGSQQWIMGQWSATTLLLR